MNDEPPPDTSDPDELRRLRHDLRSPLMVIAGFARLIAERPELSDEERVDYAQRIERAAEDIRRAIDDALG